MLELLVPCSTRTMTGPLEAEKHSLPGPEQMQEAINVQMLATLKKLEWPSKASFIQQQRQDEPYLTQQ